MLVCLPDHFEKGALTKFGFDLVKFLIYATVFRITSVVECEHTLDGSEGISCPRPKLVSLVMRMFAPLDRPRILATRP